MSDFERSIGENGERRDHIAVNGPRTGVYGSDPRDVGVDPEIIKENAAALTHEQARTLQRELQEVPVADHGSDDFIMKITKLRDYIAISRGGKPLTDVDVAQMARMSREGYGDNTQEVAIDKLNSDPDRGWKEDIEIGLRTAYSHSQLGIMQMMEQDPEKDDELSAQLANVNAAFSMNNEPGSGISLRDIATIAPEALMMMGVLATATMAAAPVGLSAAGVAAAGFAAGAHKATPSGTAEEGWSDRVTDGAFSAVLNMIGGGWFKHGAKQVLPQGPLALLHKFGTDSKAAHAAQKMLDPTQPALTAKANAATLAVDRLTEQTQVQKEMLAKVTVLAELAVDKVGKTKDGVVTAATGVTKRGEAAFREMQETALDYVRPIIQNMNDMSKAGVVRNWINTSLAKSTRVDPGTSTPWLDTGDFVKRLGHLGDNELKNELGVIVGPVLTRVRDLFANLGRVTKMTSKEAENIVEAMGVDTKVKSLAKILAANGPKSKEQAAAVGREIIRAAEKRAAMKARAVQAQKAQVQKAQSAQNQAMGELETAAGQMNAAGPRPLPEAPPVGGPKGGPAGHAGVMAAVATNDMRQNSTSVPYSGDGTLGEQLGKSRGFVK